MKFLVLALCVYAAHAASVRGFGNTKPFAQAQASVQSAPVVPPAVARSAVVGQTSDVEAPILRSESDVRPDGYSYAFETGNGIVAQSSGDTKSVDGLDVINVQGSYSFVAPDGTPISISYRADENGYQPQGDHLPVPPPIPEAILRSLEYIKNHTPQVEYQAAGPSAVASASSAYKRV